MVINWIHLMFIPKYNGGLFIEQSIKVPKTVLEDIWVETLSRLMDNPNFNSELVIKIESKAKAGLINSEDIIDLLKE